MDTFRRLFSAGVVATFLLTGCASAGPVSVTNSGSARPVLTKVAYRHTLQTATQRAIGKCVASIGFGVVAGAVLGELLGGNARAGATLGAGAGAGACAVLVSLAAEEDQARIADLERRAVLANSTQTQSFTTKSGASAEVTTRVTEAPVPQSRSKATAFTDCRYAEQALEVDGQSAPAQKQLWCRIESGDWLPYEG